MPRLIWYNCPRCGLQMKLDARQLHPCPRCNAYPMTLGKFRLTQPPRGPRVTVPLPLPTPSGTFPSLSGSNQPTQPGSFTQAGWPTQPPTYAVPARPPNRLTTWMNQSWQWFRRQSRRIQLGVGCAGVVGLLILCSCMVALAAAGNNPASSPTATPGAIAQATKHLVNQTASPTATKGTPPTATPQPSSTPTPAPTNTPPPKPTATSPPPPPPTATPTQAPSCAYGAVNGNPWCYNFQCCTVITSPPADFCSYFSCIASFWNGQGYVVQCNDGHYSKSGGRSGSCSHHGGEGPALLQP